MGCTSYTLSQREFKKAARPKLKTPGGIFYSVYVWILYNSFLIKETFPSIGTVIPEGGKRLMTFRGKQKVSSPEQKLGRLFDDPTLVI